jgi:hypothetical protein
LIAGFEDSVFAAHEKPKDKMVATVKEKMIRYVLLGMIAGFFVFPLVTYCFFDCRVVFPKRAASVLLFFFR